MEAAHRRFLRYVYRHTRMVLVRLLSTRNNGVTFEAVEHGDIYFLLCGAGGSLVPYMTATELRVSGAFSHQTVRSALSFMKRVWKTSHNDLDCNISDDAGFIRLGGNHLSFSINYHMALYSVFLDKAFLLQLNGDAFVVRIPKKWMHENDWKCRRVIHPELLNKMLLL